MKKTLWLVMACVFEFAGPTRVKADFVVDSWVLGAGCSNASGTPSVFYTQVQNPFSPSPLAVSIHNSAATAAYAFNWSLATGQFHFDADLASEGGDGLPFCGTDNRVKFHVTQDTLLSIDSEWTYQFTGGIRTSTIRFFVGDAATNQAFWIRGDVGDTVAGDPPTDTLHVVDSILLTPGNYFVRSLMDLRAVGGSPNSVSTAHGFANITLTTVPEPTSLALLVVGGLLVARRRRCLS